LFVDFRDKVFKSAECVNESGNIAPYVFVGIAFGFVRSGTGLLMLVSGWGLARWKKWGFYGAIVSNGILLAYILIGAAFSLLYCSIDPVWTVLGIAMILIIMHYLLRPDIRTRFQ